MFFFISHFLFFFGGGGSSVLERLPVNEGAVYGLGRLRTESETRQVKILNLRKLFAPLHGLETTLTELHDQQRHSTVA